MTLMAVRNTTLLALAVLLAAPSVAHGASIKVTKHTSAPTAQQFPFTLTGPKCKGSQDIPDTQQRIDFTLGAGESRTFDLCDTPPDKASRFVVSEGMTPGWRLVRIDCVSHDPDPEDAEIIEKPSVFIELSPKESKGCTFTNGKLLPPDVTTPPAVTPPAVAPPAPAPTPVAAPPTQNIGTPIIVHHKRKASRCKHGRRTHDSHGRLLRDRKGHRIAVCRPAPGRKTGTPRKPKFTG